jgi:hypothetical protein
LLERQRLIRKQATERVTKRREADAEVALQRAREQDLALRALQEEHRACLEAAQRVAKHRRRLARGDAAELKRQVQRAQDYRHAQQLVRCGLAPWLRLMAMAREVCCTHISYFRTHIYLFDLLPC